MTTEGNCDEACYVEILIFSDLSEERKKFFVTQGRAGLRRKKVEWKVLVASSFN